MVSTVLIELKSKQHIQNVTISNKAHDRVFFEGNLGDLLNISIIDTKALEMIGENGVLRVDIDQNVLANLLQSATKELDLISKVISKGVSKNE